MRRLSCLLLLLAGCRALDVVPVRDSLRAEVAAVQASFPNETHATFELRLRARNPTRQTAKIGSLSWELWLQGKWFAAGVQQLGESVSPGEVRELRVTLPLAFRPMPMTTEPTPLLVGLRGTLAARFGDASREWYFESGSRIVAQGGPAPAAESNEEE